MMMTPDIAERVTGASAQERSVLLEVKHLNAIYETGSVKIDAGLRHYAAAACPRHGERRRDLVLSEERLVICDRFGGAPADSTSLGEAQGGGKGG